MNVNILPRGTCDIAMMRELGQLAMALQAADLTVEITGAEVPGVKDGGLTIAISLASLGLAAVSTLIGTLSYWRSTRPSYTVELSSAKASYNLDNLDKNQLREIAQKLKAQESIEDIVVRVSST